MTLDHQCKAVDSDSSWEDLESEEELYHQPKPFFFAFGIEILYRPLHWITLSEKEKTVFEWT